MTLHALLVILWLLALHFLADFVLQSDRVAQAKSKDWGMLGMHASFYAGIVGVGLFLAVGVGAALLTFYLITLAAHFLTDAVTSRVNAKLWPLTPLSHIHQQDAFEPVFALRYGKGFHNFFVGVGFDQLLHQAQLILTAYGLGLLR